MTRRSERDPWRAQRIRSRVAGVIIVVIVLGAVITLIVLMTGFQSTAGADAGDVVDAKINAPTDLPQETSGLSRRYSFGTTVDQTASRMSVVAPR